MTKPLIRQFDSIWWAETWTGTAGGGHVYFYGRGTTAKEAYYQWLESYINKFNPPVEHRVLPSMASRA